jgi:prepilin-type N-terminal cleavage/methylation domain-containing protein
MTIRRRMQRAEAPASRRGFTLLEMLVAMSLTVLIAGLAIPFFRMQSRSVAAHAGRSDAMLNARASADEIERELRIAGAGIVSTQPLLVQAAADAITFNADLVTRDPADPQAVYFDDSVDSLSTIVLPRTRRITLPLSTTIYPESTYADGVGVPSRAETISFWIEPDSTPGHTGEYALYRRVNDRPASIVATGLLVTDDQPVFTYYKTDSLGAAIEIPAASLPLVHTAAIHGAADDTARSALTDSIRLVRMHVEGAYDDPDHGRVTRTVDIGIRLLNAGLVKHSACGDPPIGSTLSVTVEAGPQVELTWDAATDETGGEKDVERYALYRRPFGSTDWGEPFASVAAGLATYSYVDNAVASGEQWEYGLTAQDCTPANSSLSSAGPVSIP